MLGPRVLGPREDELLDLVELVDAEHPARVLARRAGLAAKARREADVAEREGVRVEDLVAVEAAERDLGRAREVEILAVELVDVGIRRRQPARSVQRLLAHEHGRQDGGEALRDEAVEREPVERERERAPCRRSSSRSASPRPARRAPSRSGRSPCAPSGRRARAARRRGAPRSRRPPPPSGTAASGMFGTRSQCSWRSRSAAASSASSVLELGLQPPCRLDLLVVRGLAERLLLRAHLVAPRARVAPARVGCEQGVEGLRCAAPRQRGAVAVGVGAGCAEVDHGSESRKASSTCATPSSWTGGQTQSAIARSRLSAFATATP